MATEGTPPRRRVPENLATPIYGLFVLGILYTLYVAHGVILPMILAVMTSLLLAPVVRYLQVRWRIPRVVSAMLLLVTLVAAMIGTGWLVGQPVLEWVGKAPDSLSKVLFGQSELKSTLDRVTQSAKEVEETMESLSDDEATTVVMKSQSWRQQLFQTVRNGLAGLALALALTYFLLVSGHRLIHNFVRQLKRSSRRNALRVVRNSQEQIAQYLAIITLSNTAVGILTTLMVWALGLPSPAVWGLLAGLLRFIPYLGVIITLGLLAVVSVTGLDNPWMMAVAPVGYLALTSIVGFFLEPHIHGFRMSINPVIIFVSIFFWGWLWGPVGVLLAVPLMTVIQVVLRQIPALRPVYKVIAR